MSKSKGSSLPTKLPPLEGVVRDLLNLVPEPGCGELVVFQKLLRIQNREAGGTPEAKFKMASVLADADNLYENFFLKDLASEGVFPLQQTGRNDKFRVHLYATGIESVVSAPNNASSAERGMRSLRFRVGAAMHGTVFVPATIVTLGLWPLVAPLSAASENQHATICSCWGFPMGWVHISVVINDCIELEWRDDSVIWPTTKNKEHITPGLLVYECPWSDRPRVENVLQQFAATIATWNRYCVYRKLGGNCQDFVLSLLGSVGVNMRITELPNPRLEIVRYFELQSTGLKFAKFLVVKEGRRHKRITFSEVNGDQGAQAFGRFLRKKTDTFLGAEAKYMLACYYRQFQALYFETRENKFYIDVPAAWDQIVADSLQLLQLVADV
mmetsp:Transcript_58955/g.120705  ORF Transcript_58955/g.120705 Transcript_58955/m.120705 type:complete len:384 (-) Transcript_58955:78-1229(-)|eukprot:CAMPEP_0181288678 /NCGR_PEP_ID=MMETSP1101-20121128/464_1 /TAXON_ID=46948 /ORGANISM="Rhodomonas abbreviata, Strain Caron Lab Isolate" /LENGTH=383 /DNA_ID=CAMNT_0023392823 /DNA_START=100 /DNA_END=1251 /DNA_ORIENTATION=+